MEFCKNKSNCRAVFLRVARLPAYNSAAPPEHCCIYVLTVYLSTPSPSITACELELISSSRPWYWHVSVSWELQSLLQILTQPTNSAKTSTIFIIRTPDSLVTGRLTIIYLSFSFGPCMVEWFFPVRKARMYWKEGLRTLYLWLKVVPSKSLI